MDNTNELKNAVLKFAVTPQRASSGNKTPYEEAKLKTLAQLDKAWAKYNAGQLQHWFFQDGLDLSQVYFVIRYGRLPVNEKQAVSRSSLPELYRVVRQAIEADAFKDEILRAQAKHSAAMRQGRKVALAA